jgi:ATP-dependent DNA helicase RecQ
VETKLNTYLEQHLVGFKSRPNQRPILIVFQGFDQSFLSTLQSNKLFDESLGGDLETLASRKAALIPQLFQVPIRDWHWCSREEMIAVGFELLPLYFSLYILRNNLFHRTYPSLYSFGAAPLFVEAVGTDEPEVDDNGNEAVTLLSKFYGSIRTIGDKYYITYADHIENEIPFYTITGSLQTEVISGEEDNIHLELSDIEDNFLILEDRLLTGSIEDKIIRVALTGELVLAPHRYEERLLVMQSILQNQYQFVIAEKETVRKPERDDSSYRAILKKYWGHAGFRSLRMYRNIHSRSRDKSTVEISQSQVIDDLVQEALKAYEGKDFKDIFVTSPTGAGKSVMFQIPAIYLAEQYQLMTIVISPLIGLMMDQVQGLVSRNVEMSATINSDISPVERMEIRERIQEGKTSILYISPETLLSRSDITQLIGERKVGLFVVDEAHIVTTWGKAFRSDYWYLGTYLTKLRQKLNFPIATFTATAIYGGLEDMYEETRNSLNMIMPICYFGYVRRDNLEIRIKKGMDKEKKFSEYLTEKNTILLHRLEKFVGQGIKSLVYFPTVKSILDFRQFVQIYGTAELWKHLTIYYGPLEKEQKNENYLKYKRNDSLTMLATKAFGMGIDIPDIKNVYHYAPTGNVCDYVQEIGRAARDIPTGYAYFDFLPKDFVHVQRLHGISTIEEESIN